MPLQYISAKLVEPLLVKPKAGASGTILSAPRPS